MAQARISEQQYLDSLRHLLLILLEVSAAGLLASALISAVLAGRALQPIKAALRRQRDFVADAAHELRTPLAIMRGASELGLAAGIGTEQEASLEQVLAQNAHLTRLVEDLSTLARADSGVVDLARARGSVSPRRRDGRGRERAGRGAWRAPHGRDARCRTCHWRRGTAAPGVVDLARQCAHTYTRRRVDHSECDAAGWAGPAARARQRARHRACGPPTFVRALLPRRQGARQRGEWPGLGHRTLDRRGARGTHYGR